MSEYIKNNTVVSMIKNTPIHEKIVRKAFVKGTGKILGYAATVAAYNVLKSKFGGR